jgi:predicted RNase H-like nuclease
VLPDAIPGVGGVVADDVVDAAAVAWTARRIATGAARTLPEVPEPGDGGRAVAIWC